MGLKLIPAKLREKFTIEEREHAVAILKYDFPDEWKDILGCLEAFWLTRKKDGAGAWWQQIQYLQVNR